MSSSLRLVSSRIPRSSSRFSSFKSTLGRRNVHQVKELPYPIEQGLGKFLPPAALKTLMEYQKGLLDRLNDEIKTDTSAEPHATVATITINYATRRERILAFNYGALALNNSFFLEQLAPPPDEESGVKSHQGYISDELFEKIRDHYGDIIGLKSTFSASALGMFSSGWVWMVTDGEGNLGVLPTLGPSTLLVRSRTNMHYLAKENNQAIGANIIIKDPQSTTPRPIPSLPGAGPSSPFSGMPTQPPSQGLFSDHTRAFSANSTQANDYRSGAATMYGDSPSESAVRGSNIPSALAVGNVIFPLFCVPVYEHAWMSAGFGVWGKEDWLKEFWSVLDWRKVSRAYRAARESTINVHG